MLHRARRGRLWIIAGAAPGGGRGASERVIAGYAASTEVTSAAIAGVGGPAWPVEYPPPGAVVGCVRVTGTVRGGDGPARQPVEAAAAWLWACDEPEMCAPGGAGRMRVWGCGRS